jgi:ubiquinone biosynthesis protein
VDAAQAVGAEQHPEGEERNEEGEACARRPDRDHDRGAQNQADEQDCEAFIHGAIIPCGRSRCRVEHFGSMAAPPKTRKIGRLSEIAQVAVRHGFGYFFHRHRLTDVLPWTTRVEVDRNGAAGSERGRRLREMLDELGPTFVKFGQLLSTRPDVVPPDIVAELRGLQDDVRPFPFAQVRAVVEAELELTLEQAFLHFDEQPIAAASIGQVHRATLPNGDDVVVKVQRPNAPRQIESDLALLYQAARMIKERVRALDFIDAHELVDEFARFIRQELDYNLEARNADVFRRNFAGSERVVIPKVYWSYSGTRMLTLEFIEGVQLADLDFETTSLDERRELAYRATETWMEMIFRHGFFHGDPHPANVLILADGRIGLVDFGLVGKLTDEDMARLTRLFIDAATENVDALPRRLAELGVRYPKEREEEFRTALRDLYYRYFGASLAEIDPIQVIREAFALIYSMNLHLPTRFVLLDKAIATLGGVGVELYPEFNVFEVARPYARELMLERFTPKRLAQRAQTQGRELAWIASQLPYQIHDILEEVRDGQMEVGFVHKGLDEFMQKIDVVFNRLVVALVVAGGLLGSSMIGVLATDGPQIFGIHFLSVIGFVASSALGVWLLVGVLRSGRL